jgi:hypothetical protein
MTGSSNAFKSIWKDAWSRRLEAGIGNQNNSESIESDPIDFIQAHVEYDYTQAEIACTLGLHYATVM